MDAVIVAAVVSLAVSLLTIAADSYRQRRQLHAERLNELRDLYDQGGAAITAALYAFDRRAVAVTEQGRSLTGEEFDKKVESVEFMDARIAIRLGDEPEVGTYGEARERLEELRKLIFEAGERLTDEQKARADDLRKQVVQLRGEYLEHARRRLDE